MTEQTTLKVRLIETVRDFSGNLYQKGTVLEARVAPDGVLEVVGIQYLPLCSDEWELVLTDEDLERLFDG